MFKSFHEIIGIWDSTAELATKVGVPLGRALKWNQRGYIPPEYWPGLIKAAKRKGRAVTADNMARIVAEARLPNRGAA